MDYDAPSLFGGLLVMLLLNLLNFSLLRGSLSQHAQVVVER
jgi:hypothetical protein